MFCFPIDIAFIFKNFNLSIVVLERNFDIDDLDKKNMFGLYSSIVFGGRIHRISRWIPLGRFIMPIAWKFVYARTEALNCLYPIIFFIATGFEYNAESTIIMHDDINQD